MSSYVDELLPLPGRLSYLVPPAAFPQSLVKSLGSFSSFYILYLSRVICRLPITLSLKQCKGEGIVPAVQGRACQNLLFQAKTIKEASIYLHAASTNAVDPK